MKEGKVKVEPKAPTQGNAPEWSPALERQANLKAAVQSIRHHAKVNQLGGFVQASIDAAQGEATVFWHGELPRDVREIAANSSAGAIRFVQVPYSIEVLRSEAKRIATEYPYVVSAGPSSDYKSLNVRVDETKMTPDALKISSSVPVNILPGGNGGFAPLRRDLDVFPLWGGTWIFNPDSGASCSSGFAMFTELGNEVISTAAHCSTAGSDSSWWDPRETKIYGFESRRDFATDSMFLVIDPNQTDKAQPVVYRGGWQSGEGVGVEDWFDPLLGELTCDSGGLSGEVCGARVNATDTFLSNGVGPGYITDDSGANSFGSSGGGDSGGPNYTYNTGSTVIASGEIVAGYVPSETGCSPDAVPAPDRPCYFTVFHTNIEATSAALLARPQVLGE